MEGIVDIKRILVVRNDTTTQWKNSSYILEKGELGVGWIQFDDKVMPITKIGNGKDLWINLPQNDYLLTEDQILTCDFGRHKIENGHVNAGGKGMLFSEWVLDALNAEIQPEIITPRITHFSIQSIGIDTNTCEVGSILNEIVWDAGADLGHYEFGTLEDKNNKIPDLDTTYTLSLGNTAIEGQSDLSLLNKSVITNIRIEEGKINYGPLKLSYSWGDSKNTPLTNLGNKANNKIYSNEMSMSIDIILEGYRERCFFGGINTDISDAVIRALDKTGYGYKGRTSHSFTVSPGSSQIVIASDARYPGPISILNTTASAEMIHNFIPSTIEVPGANGYESITYNVLTYTPANPYTKEANIIITLGQEE